MSDSQLMQLLDRVQSPDKERVLQIGEKIAHFDPRMIESSTSAQVVYGQAKKDGSLSKSDKMLCASFQKKANQLELSLYLPFPKKSVRKGIVKMKIATEDWQTATQLYPPSQYRYPWTKPNEKFIELETYQTIYQSITGKEKVIGSLDDLVSIALEEWIERI